MQRKFPGCRKTAPLVLVAMLSSCGSPQSSSTSGPDNGPVPTSRMTIRLTVETRDDGPAVVRANLNDGKPAGNSYRLDGGDYLRACLDADCHMMADNDSVFEPDYIARFDYRPGIDYVVAFNRIGAVNAPNSRVTLPQDFTIVTPANHQQVTDGETVIVAWSPTGTPATATLSYEATCRSAGGSEVLKMGVLTTDSDGNGRESVRIDPIVDAARSGGTLQITGCAIVLVVHHELPGRIDPAFRTGIASGAVLRTVTLDYVPR